MFDPVLEGGCPGFYLENKSLSFPSFIKRGFSMYKHA
jgi:hypothetical protein